MTEHPSITPNPAGIPSAVLGSAGLVVVTAVDGVLRDIELHSCADARIALGLLASRDIPLVLASPHSAEELLSLQSDLELVHPFICDRGAALYIPRGYFPQARIFLEGEGDWNVVPFRGIVDFATPIEILTWLYRRAQQIVTIGLAADWSHRRLLEAVDVPIIVSNESFDQTRLRQAHPTAYVTKAQGPVGWSEAIVASAVRARGHSDHVQ